MFTCLTIVGPCGAYNLLASQPYLSCREVERGNFRKRKQISHQRIPFATFPAGSRTTHEMQVQPLQQAIATVPPGRWAVGVSGGADSVALLWLLASRPDLHLHVVHLDHQTRGEESRADAQFVSRLADELALSITIRTRDRVENGASDLPSNASARYRAARFRLFGQVVAEARLNGVLLAHHADDQAETILQRLLRGSQPAGLAGIAGKTSIGGLVVLRPLLHVRRDQLRDYLRATGRTWREDASNASDGYQRNRLRRWLASNPSVGDALLELATSCRALNQWSRANAPRLEESFSCATVAQLPQVLARQSVRAWLCAQGARAGELTPLVLDRLIAMCCDAAAPHVCEFPGGLRVQRRGGSIIATHAGAERRCTHRSAAPDASDCRETCERNSLAIPNASGAARRTALPRREGNESSSLEPS